MIRVIARLVTASVLLALASLAGAVAMELYKHSDRSLQEGGFLPTFQGFMMGGAAVILTTLALFGLMISLSALFDKNFPKFED